MRRLDNPEFQRLKSFCTHVGQDPLLVQGAGGNASWKSENVVWVKASGTWLAAASSQNIFLPIRRPSGLLDTIANNRSYKFDLLDPAYGRPSIETVLHCVLQQRFVLHVHAINPLALLIREDAESVIAQRLVGKLPYVFVPYAKPGHELGREVVSRLVAAGSSCNVLLLANHGIVIAGETIDEINANLDQLCAACAPDRIYKPKLPPLPNSSLNIDGTNYDPVSARHLHALATDDRLSDHTTRHWALYPDHVVFLGPRAAVFESTDHARQCMDSAKAPFVFIRDSGVWQRRDATLAALAQLQCYYDVLIRLDEACSLASLTTMQIEELLDWDSEKHRQALNR